MAVKQGLHWNPALLKSSPLYRPLPRDMAERVSLVYVSDEEPGIRRRRSGTGFSYVGLGGKTIRDSRIIKRINALAIPPAWTDVWISADPDGHIKATGRDVEAARMVDESVSVSPNREGLDMAAQLWTMFGDTARAAQVRSRMRQAGK